MRYVIDGADCCGKTTALKLAAAQLGLPALHSVRHAGWTNKIWQTVCDDGAAHADLTTQLLLSAALQRNCFKVAPQSCLIDRGVVSMTALQFSVQLPIALAFKRAVETYAQYVTTEPYILILPHASLATCQARRQARGDAADVFEQNMPALHDRYAQLRAWLPANCSAMRLPYLDESDFGTNVGYPIISDDGDLLMTIVLPAVSIFEGAADNAAAYLVDFISRAERYYHRATEIEKPAALDVLG